MSELNPYRPAVSSSWTEEELWMELDASLECSLRDTHMAWSLAWNVLVDSQRLGLKAVETAALSLLHELTPDGLPPDWLLPDGRIDICAASAVEE